MYGIECKNTSTIRRLSGDFQIWLRRKSFGNNDLCSCGSPPLGVLAILASFNEEAISGIMARLVRAFFVSCPFDDGAVRLLRGMNGERITDTTS